MEATSPESAGCVLIADDHAPIRLVLAAKLRQGGFQVLMAENGKEALELARKHRPSVLVSDYKMPEMDGMQLCRALAADPSTADIPVVLVTAYDARVLQEPIGQSNIVAMISKPFSPSEVIRLVTELACPPAPAPAPQAA